MGPESRKATATVQQQQQQRLAGKQLPGNGWLQFKAGSGADSPQHNRVAPIKRIPSQRFEDPPKKGPHLKSKPPVSKRPASYRKNIPVTIIPKPIGPNRTQHLACWTLKFHGSQTTRSTLT